MNKLSTIVRTGISSNSMKPPNVSSLLGKFVVPKIVHFTWYSKTKLTFRFHHFLSMLSAQKRIEPEKIMFWYEIYPKGKWWERAKKAIPQIEMRYRKAPMNIFGNIIRVPEHQSDIVRLEAVMKFGGIYMDLDVIALKSFDPLLVYNTTMGYETRRGLCNGIIISAPNAEFLKIWHSKYKTFNDVKWNKHSVVLPACKTCRKISKSHPHRMGYNASTGLDETGKTFHLRTQYYLRLE